MPSIRHTNVEESVLDAARASILAVGWRRTTLTGVAQRAGVSRMTVYRRWPDMAALLGDLMTREWQRTLDGVPLDGDLTSAVLGLVRRLRGDDLFARIVDVDPELLLPYLLDRRGRSQQLLLDALVPALRRGQRAGTVRAGNPQVLARALLLAVHGFALSASTMVDDRVGARTLDRELGILVERYLAP